MSEAKAIPHPVVESVPLSKLKPWDQNPRKNHAVDAISASIERFGYLAPIIVQKGTYRILAGHGRFAALKKAKARNVPVIVAEISDQDAALFTIADNKIGSLSDWDFESLAVILKGVDFSVDLKLTDLGWTDFELRKIIGKPSRMETKGDDIPEIRPDQITKPGDLWELGDHRVLCGDSTKSEDVARLIGDAKSPLLHADPPYGMGKEAEGIANDNLYREKLDAFQISWWKTWRPFLMDNASAYIWGQAEDLWRLWYLGSLKQSERITFRNEIVWDKAAGLGQSSETHRQYATSTERCLFFMLGEQGFGNMNKEDYWEGFEPIRSYLAAEAEKIGWGAKDVARITGVGMYGHWFTKSQWVMIPEGHYQKLQKSATGNGFSKPYAEIRALYDGQLTEGGHLAAKQAFYGTRAYFDNVHDNMRDVWDFPRVTGEDRFEHSTPKPVAMIARALKSSAPEGAVVLEPFSGTGSTLIAAEETGRKCYAMEIIAAYTDIVVRRWQKYTRRQARNLSRPDVVIV